MRRQLTASVGTVVIHLGLLLLLAVAPPPLVIPRPPIEVSFVVEPAVVDTPPVTVADEPAPAVVTAPGPVASESSPIEGKPRRARAGAIAPVTAPASSAGGDVAVAEPSTAGLEAPTATAPSGLPGNGGTGLPMGSGPVPLADYSQVALPLAPELLAKFAGRDVVIDLFVDEDGRVHHTARLDGVDGRIDNAVAKVSEQFLFLPARDPTGKATAGVVTYRFKVRAIEPGSARTSLLVPLAASSALSSVTGGAHGLPDDGDQAVASAPRTDEQRAIGRALARGIGGTMFGAGDAVVAPSRGKSGLPRQRRIAQLSRRDKEQLCAWAVTTRGGARHADSCKFVEDREIDNAAGRARWYEGAKDQNGNLTWTPWWYGNAKVGDDNFIGRYESPEPQVVYNRPKPRGIGLKEIDMLKYEDSKVTAARVTTGRMTNRMEGPERIARVETEAVCVAGLDEAKVCSITVADLEACADALAQDPCLGAESQACLQVQKCGSVGGK